MKCIILLQCCAGALVVSFCAQVKHLLTMQPLSCVASYFSCMQHPTLFLYEFAICKYIVTIIKTKGLKVQLYTAFARWQTCLTSNDHVFMQSVQMHVLAGDIHALSNAFLWFLKVYTRKRQAASYIVVITTQSSASSWLQLGYFPW